MLSYTFLYVPWEPSVEKTKTRNGALAQQVSRTGLHNYLSLSLSLAPSLSLRHKVAIQAHKWVSRGAPWRGISISGDLSSKGAYYYVRKRSLYVPIVLWGPCMSITHFACWTPVLKKHLLCSSYTFLLRSYTFRWTVGRSYLHHPLFSPSGPLSSQGTCYAVPIRSLYVPIRSVTPSYLHHPFFSPSGPLSSKGINYYAPWSLSEILQKTRHCGRL